MTDPAPSPVEEPRPPATALKSWSLLLHVIAIAAGLWLGATTFTAITR
ncbi:hypothetical protein ACFQX7_04345 [Luedemannella flava]